MDTLNGRKIAAFFLEKMRIIAYHDVAKNVQKKEQSCLVCDDLLKQTYNKISFKERKTTENILSRSNCAVYHKK